jgi:hypothetical protein
MLKALPGGPFYFSGSHSKISACVLPRWIPETFVDEMNRTWGGILQGELLKLANNVPFPRPRRVSSGSDAPSIRSLNSEEKLSRKNEIGIDTFDSLHLANQFVQVS